MINKLMIVIISCCIGIGCYAENYYGNHKKEDYTKTLTSGITLEQLSYSKPPAWNDAEWREVVDDKAKSDPYTDCWIKGRWVEINVIIPKNLSTMLTDLKGKNITDEEWIQWMFGNPFKNDYTEETDGVVIKQKIPTDKGIIYYIHHVPAVIAYEIKRASCIASYNSCRYSADWRVNNNENDFRGRMLTEAANWLKEQKNVEKNLGLLIENHESINQWNGNTIFYTLPVGWAKLNKKDKNGNDYFEILTPNDVTAEGYVRHIMRLYLKCDGNSLNAVLQPEKQGEKKMWVVFKSQ